MSDNNFKKLGIAPRFHEVLSTGLYTGIVSVAPGTAAALVALVLWYGLYLVLSPTLLFWTTISLIIVVTIVGVWTSNVMEQYWGPDPRAVVIDEYVGTGLPLLVAPCGKNTWLLAIIGFISFRIIDIVKPLGCRKIEQIMPGGWGVMFDDVLAGLYALIIVILVKTVILQGIMKIPGLTFSWKRALGITQAKQLISRRIGIPMTKGWYGA